MPEQEDSTIHLGISTIVPLLQAATKARRNRVTDPLINPWDRDQLIFFGLSPLPLRVRPDGWVRIGYVTDHIAGVRIAVEYEPVTRATRMVQVDG